MEPRRGGRRMVLRIERPHARSARRSHSPRTRMIQTTRLDLFAGIPVADYAAALKWYERLLGSLPTFFPNDTEAVWELAEHRYVYIVQVPEHAGHARHTLFVDDLDALVAPDRRAGTQPRGAGNLLERRAQDHVPRSRRKRDRLWRRSAVTSFWPGPCPPEPNSPYKTITANSRLHVNTSAGRGVHNVTFAVKGEGVLAF